MSKKNKGKYDTRQKILAAATKKIAEKGYERATIAEIASEAGISEGAIYRHFDKKETLLVECISPVLDEIVEFIPKDLNDFETTEDAVRFLVSIRLHMFDKYDDLFKILFSEMPHSPELAQKYFSSLQKHTDKIDKAFDWFINQEQLKRPPLRNLFAISLGQLMGLWATKNMVRMLKGSYLNLPDQIPESSEEHLIEDITEFYMYGVAGVPDSDGHSREEG